jgi:hypothetical protein
MQILPIVLTVDEVRKLLHATTGQVRTLRSPRFSECKDGERRWVQEPWGKVGDNVVFQVDISRSGVNADEKLSGKECSPRSAEELPRDASRLTLDVIEVRSDDYTTEIMCRLHKQNVDKLPL